MSRCRKLLSTLSIVIIIINMATFTACTQNKTNSKKQDKKQITISEDNKLLQHFKKTHGGMEVIRAAEEDLTCDGVKDLVVIFNTAKDKNAMVIVVEKNGQYQFTNELPAPIQNQKIEFKDIDNKPPMEMVVSGSKASKFGYGIYRVENMKLIDLFGDGMKDCC